MSSLLEHVNVDVAAGTNSSGEPVFERLPARLLDDGTYQIVSSPMLVLGLAAGDQITLLDGEFQVVSRSGNIAVQVFGAPAAVVASLREAVATLGGNLDGQEPRAVVFTIPVAVGFQAIESVFNQAEVDWYFGNVYDSDGVTPLLWWES